MAFITGLIAMIPATVWKYLGIVALIGAAYFFVDERATLRERAVQVAKCEAAAKVAQNAADAQDLKAEKDGRAQDLEITNDLIEAKRKSDAEIQQLKSDLAKQPTARRCILTDDDVERVR